MAGTFFYHPAVGSLSLQLAPTEVNWSYSLNTSTTNTYAGQVVQILSLSFDSLTITGRFGKNGVDSLKNMNNWFNRYFAVASSGTKTDGSLDVNYNETPMIIRYEGTTDVDVDENQDESQWKAYPTSFPSYRRANDNFAPEWQIECNVHEAPGGLQEVQMEEAISRLKYHALYTPGSPFSDPNPLPNTTLGKTQQAIDTAIKASFAGADKIVDFYTGMLPTLSIDELYKQLADGASVAATIKRENNTALTRDPFSAVDNLIP